MKNLIYTVQIGRDLMDPNKRQMYIACADSQERYAKRIGADFYCQMDKKMNLSDYYNDEKLYIYTLLGEYDRVLFLDADVLVKPDAPDIFAQYKDDRRVRMLNESKFNHRNVMDVFIPDILRLRPELTPTIPALVQREYIFCYFNVGVILASTEFRGLFKITDNYFNPPFWRADQDFVNYRVYSQWIKSEFTGEFLAELPLVWNGMFVFDQHADENCHFIHYAGGHIELALEHYKKFFGIKE